MPVALEVVSPEKLLLSRDVDMVVIPASEGDMGVLPNHAPMIVLLRGGTIAITEGGRVTDRLFVSGGFAEITPERCTVLADEAVPTSELSARRGRAPAGRGAGGLRRAPTRWTSPRWTWRWTVMQSARAMVEAACQPDCGVARHGTCAALSHSRHVAFRRSHVGCERMAGCVADIEIER